MENKIIKTISEYIGYLERVLGNQSARLDDLKYFTGIYIKEIVRPSGRKYYYRLNPDYKHHSEKSSDNPGNKETSEAKVKSCWYIGSEFSEDVQLIKEARYYTESIPVIESNLNLCRNLIDKFKLTDYDSINEVIPTVYKYPSIKLIDDIRSPNAARWKAENEAYKASCGPWYPEGLKVTTADRKKVRSKSEGMIYNQLFWQNLTFVYELPITLPYGITRHPDFTVLSEIDWLSIVLIDHEGMYGFEKDRKRYENDMYMYWQNGFIPGVNIFYTFDDPSGGFDISTIQNIIDTRIRPKS